MASLEIRGINKVVDEIRKFGIATEKIIEAETRASAEAMVLDAKQRAPKNFGKLAQSISAEKIRETHYKISVNESYGAYMEFGTGHKVKVPAEFNEIALQFKGSGRGPQLKGNSFQDGLDSVTEWCRAKGIPIIQAKWIFLKILGAGVNPQPFLYPAWVKGKKDYLGNLNNALKQLNKKI